ARLGSLPAPASPPRAAFTEVNAAVIGVAAGPAFTDAARADAGVSASTAVVCSCSTTVATRANGDGFGATIARDLCRRDGYTTIRAAAATAAAARCRCRAHDATAAATTTQTLENHVQHAGGRRVSPVRGKPRNLCYDEGPVGVAGSTTRARQRALPAGGDLSRRRIERQGDVCFIGNRRGD